MGPDLVFYLRFTVVFALALFMTVTGLWLTYWAVSGQTDRLTFPLEGVFEERPHTHRWLWAVGGPVDTVLGATMVALLTWVFV